jgi:hypothetical protein
MLRESCLQEPFAQDQCLVRTSIWADAGHFSHIAHFVTACASLRHAEAMPLFVLSGRSFGVATIRRVIAGLAVA